jgi:hypothetical protein
MTRFPANPLVRDGTDAAVSHCTKSDSVTSKRRTNPSSFLAHRSCDSTSNDPTTQPSRRLRRRCEPLMARDIHRCAQTDEISRSESDDPVCRPIRRFLFRLSLFRLSFHLACAAKPLGAELRVSRLRGTIVSGRFRACKLVGSNRYSKCFFAGVQCCAVMTQPRRFCHILQRRGHAAYRTNRPAEGKAQGPPVKTTR